MRTTEAAIRAQMRDVKMPPEMLMMGSGDSEELAEYLSSVAYIASACDVCEKPMSTTALAIIAYEHGWTREQKDMAAEVMKLNGVWRE